MGHAGTDPTELPYCVLWNITYACPLRCEFCYTESGRRPSRHLPTDRTLDLARTIAKGFAPKQVVIAGGEPLIMKSLLPAAEILRGAGLNVALYTSGFGLTRELACEVTRVFDAITLSIDAPTAELHDALRGRAGSFQAAVDGLRYLDELAGERPGTFSFGVECTVVRANFAAVLGMIDLVRTVAPRAWFLGIDAGIPGGLASREGYARNELMTDDQYAHFRDGTLAESLRDVSAGLRINVSDNWDLLMRHADGALRSHIVVIEPDGDVRAMPNYEGTVGNIFEAPVEDLWRRARERWRDPVVVDAVAAVRTLEEWAGAVRRIDRHFANGPELLRLTSRSAPSQPSRQNQ